MHLGELVFRLEHYRNDEWELGDNCFVFYKVEHLVRQYQRFFGRRADFAPRHVLELGLWDGGSLAFWNEILLPEKIVGVDLTDKENSRYFREYLESRDLGPRVQTFWRTDQADRHRLKQIVDSELGGGLDLVIDDASHQYLPTKVSFETLFPRLRPGGFYIIEDWAWGYWSEFQSPDHPWSGRPHPGRLVNELVAAAGSARSDAEGRPWIAEVSVFQGFAAVERGGGDWTSDEPLIVESLVTRPEIERRSPARAMSGEATRVEHVVRDAPRESSLDPRLIAFYLPQFHPIPENDVWWGKGFTEWTNVTKGRPRFAGHDQPHLPSELGFYDLRVPEVRSAQAELARAHGIHGFCYYHYWFEGRTLLERPFREVLSSGEPDFPFCLCWANENWTKAWDGKWKDVLIEQRHNEQDDRRHIRHLMKAFHDSRYIRIDGKPLFLVYRVAKLPDPRRTSEIFREEAKRSGLDDIYLASVESLDDPRLDPASLGFDASVEFQPDWPHMGGPVRCIDGETALYDYATVMQRMCAREQPPYKRLPGVMTGWDNSARRYENAVIFEGSTPSLYEEWLRSAIDRARTNGSEVVFVNAWNEWAEAAHLEPCQKWGRAYLEATLRAFQTREELLHPKASITSVAQKTPKVSVCVPTFNGATFLSEAIESVLNQRYSDFELIIVDDASTDGTQEIIRSFDDRRIDYRRNEQRMGLVGNWNRCLELASAPYVTVFHQDDVMLPEHLERKLALLEANPSVGMAHSNVRQIGADGEILSEWWYEEPRPTDAGVMAGRELFERLLWGGNVVCCPSVLMRHECYQRLGGFDPSLPFTADWEMWLRIALHYDVGYLTESHLEYRRHDGNETTRFLGARGLKHYYLARARILEKFPDRVGNVADVRARLIRHHAEEALRNADRHFELGQPEQAEEYLVFALELRGGQNGGPPDLLADLPFASNGSHRLEGLSGERLAQLLSSRKMFKTACFKLAARPELRWLYRLRELGRRVLPG